ncbi:histidine phosphatase family protein [Kribbia dieselivorans]|uniref:histidine phosphatase family protein n=1 Tax=Kribbia dieselivorans TaxID=331526 RepID=UPI0009F992E1|nr:histidine phosphatase family protein [Kribbia dieselivorans]
MNPRRLILLRHGQTNQNAAGIWQGQLDSELSPIGHAQARAAAAALAGRGIARVVASDLQRAASTGADVAAAAGVSIAYDERLREIHAGQWTGMTASEVYASYPEDRERLLRGEDFKRGVTGESVAEVRVRARPVTDEVVAGMEPGECVLLASHGVTLRVLAADLVGLPQQAAWTALSGLGNCHWAELVERSTGGWRLDVWNGGAEGVPATGRIGGPA